VTVGRKIGMGGALPPIAAEGIGFSVSDGARPIRLEGSKNLPRTTSKKIGWRSRQRWETPLPMIGLELAYTARRLAAAHGSNQAGEPHAAISVARRRVCLGGLTTCCRDRGLTSVLRAGR